MFGKEAFFRNKVGTWRGTLGTRFCVTSNPLDHMKGSGMNWPKIGKRQVIWLFTTNVAGQGRCLLNSAGTIFRLQSWFLGNASFFSQNVCSQFLCPLTPPSQPAKWWISSWISIARTSNRIANTPPELRTNPPRIANKQNYEQTGVSEFCLHQLTHQPIFETPNFCCTFGAFKIFQRGYRAWLLANTSTWW